MSSESSKVVLLTGAGCSALAGMSTLKTVIESIQCLPLNIKNPSIEVVRETWKCVQGQKGDSGTLEDLIAFLKAYSDIADRIKDSPVLAAQLGVAYQPNIVNGQFKMAWEDALSYCFRLVIDTYGPHRVETSSEGLQTIHDVIKYLAIKNGGRLDLFTTNYDCLLNVLAATSDDITFYTHINNENGEFARDWFVNKKIERDGVGPNVYIHRLHGCVAWFADSRGPYGVHEVYGAGGGKSKLIIDDQRKLNQMAIKLVADKLGEIPAFSLAFEELCEALANCDTLLVWGHSFRDQEVLRNIIKVVEKRQDRPFQLWYIDAYLDVGAVINNTIQTLRGVVAVNPGVLRPLIRDIGWKMQNDRLIELIDNKIMKSLPEISQPAKKARAAAR